MFPLRVVLYNLLFLFVGLGGEEERCDGAEVVEFCVLTLVRWDGGVVKHGEPWHTGDCNEAWRGMGCC